MKDNNTLNSNEIFEQLKNSILNLDPVVFCENYLTLDGERFKLRGNGYKPFVDIYRYIGLKALEKTSKPIILVKGRQVGATTMGANLEMYWMGCGLFGVHGRPPIRIMHCFPQLDLAAAYSKTKLNPVINSSLILDNGKQSPGKKVKTFLQSLLSPDVENSLQYKEFKNGNHIWIESTGLNGDRIRGRTVDVMIYDEVQDMPKEALANAAKILSQAQYGPPGYGVQIFMGTPKGKDTVYYDMWQKSTQQYFHLRCEACDDYFPLYAPGTDDWEKTWLYEFFVRCTKCGHIQDKRKAADRGKWIGRKDEVDCDFIGFHINQIYMPNFTKKRITKEKPGVSAVNTERAWQNEVLGEFYSGSGVTITSDEIRALCGDTERKMRSRIMAGEQKLVYMGADWGKKVDIDSIGKGEKKTQQGQSYSTIVIISVEGPELINIQFATKLKRNDMQYKIDVIDQAFLNYNVVRAVGDIGYAGDLTEILQKKYGDKFLASEAAGGKLLHKMKFNEDVFPQVITFDKNKLIEEMFSLFRKGCIRFPYGSYEHIAWLVNHCTSMEVKPTMDRSGNINITYAKGGSPNDGFMALINAYLAFKFDVSSGFKNTKMLYSLDELKFEDVSKKNTASSMGALGVYMPGMRCVV